MFLVVVVVAPGRTGAQILLVMELGSALGKEIVSKTACWANATPPAGATNFTVILVCKEVLSSICRLYE
jgi:hypothetical protein